MVIASSGCFVFWDDEIVAKQTETYARVTHADPRCIYSSVATVLLRSRYIRWNAGIGGKYEPNIDETLQFAKKIVPDIDCYEKDVNFYSNRKKVEELELSEYGKKSAVWALRF